MAETTIGLAGNPNCGKTTLFNELTGSNGYVGNWPGVTVEKKQATWRADKNVTFVDLPGIYSLSPYTPEEIVSRDYIVGERPDAVINLVDVTNLERNLYLTTQLIEAGRPVVVGLNMCDLLKERGDVVDAAALSKRLGVPVVEVSALRNTNLDALVKEAVAAGRAGKVQPGAPCFSPEVEDALGKIAQLISGSCDANLVRWYSIKVFERDAESVKALHLSSAQLNQAEKIVRAVETSRDDDAESIITSDRYDWIAEVMAACVKKAPKKLSMSERIDKVVTSRVLGLPIFVAVMFVVYYIAVSTVGDWGTVWANDEVFGEGWELFGMAIPSIPAVVEGWLAAAGASDMVSSLVLDGIVGGVGSVLGFIPQMLVLFMMLAFLEDCGYMSRVAFVMDRLFRRFGLSGKSFIPFLISSGCGVPGVMATKTIENEKDRRMTAMLTTMIPCGAKTPIIALVMGVLVGGADAWWVAPMFYFLGLAAIVVSALMLKKTRMFAGEPAPFVMELPDYHLPALKSWWLHVWERISAYLKKAAKAATIIFAACVVVWFLSSFGFASWEGGDGSFGFLASLPGAPEYSADYSLLAIVALRAARRRQLAGDRRFHQRPHRQGEPGLHLRHDLRPGRGHRGRPGHVASLRGNVHRRRGCHARWRDVRVRGVQHARRAVLRRHRHHPQTDGLAQVVLVRNRLPVRLCLVRGPHHQPALGAHRAGELRRVDRGGVRAARGHDLPGRAPDAQGRADGREDPRPALLIGDSPQFTYGAPSVAGPAARPSRRLGTFSGGVRVVRGQLPEDRQVGNWHCLGST